MTSDLASEAKAIVALAFRNGPIEKLHGGKICPACDGASGVSRISDDEMKVIMKNAVNLVYKLLRLKADDPGAYARQIAYGARCALAWDEPNECLNRIPKQRPTGSALLEAPNQHWRRHWEPDPSS